ncbi:hypothetical protein RvY_18204-2 [Ramazzottius varieornatus]|uniref:Uncharacterized protein n=1 Tax=Ramazzottius varieornatus TaxID=947166 RepID=A0A1D1W8B6_RAMVA|nr:hypothetical protein RvY_18204-2 [Ramazzottius varieornatus]
MVNITQRTTTPTSFIATTQSSVTTTSLTAVQPTTTSTNSRGPDPVVVVAFILLGLLILLLTGIWAYDYWQERGLSGRRRRKSHESDEIAFDVLRHRDDASVLELPLRSET